MSDALTSALRQLAQVLIERHVLSAVEVNTVIDRLNDECNWRGDDDREEYQSVITALNDAISAAAEFDPKLGLPTGAARF